VSPKPLSHGRSFPRYRKLILLDVVMQFYVTVQQKQEEKRQKEELFKEKDRERKRAKLSKKVTELCNMERHLAVSRGVI